MKSSPSVLVVNTSPLIHLAEAGLLDLLQAAAEEIWVPEPVAREILAYGDADPTASACEQPLVAECPGQRGRDCRYRLGPRAR